MNARFRDLIDSLEPQFRRLVAMTPVKYASLPRQIPSGEVVLQEGTSYSANGFCVVTDPDGDTINLLWIRTNVPGPAAEPKTKGTYLSGTGKYSGIQGYYTFSCRQGGTVCTTTSGEYKIP